MATARVFRFSTVNGDLAGDYTIWSISLGVALLLLTLPDSSAGQDNLPAAANALAADTPGSTPDAPKTARLRTIVTLGDSITKGVRSGVTAGQTFAGLVEGRLKEDGADVRVVNVGIGGERTDQALLRLERIIAAEQPDVVSIMYGTNDSYVDIGKTENRITVDQYRTNLNQIVAELLKRGILPVLMTEPRWSDDAAPNGLGENPNIRLEPYVVACRETALQWRVPLVDHFEDWTKARDNGTNLREWTTDGCHPNPRGHQRLTDLMAPVLQQSCGLSLRFQERLLAGEKLRIVCFGDSVTGVYYHTGSLRAYTDMLGLALKRCVPTANVELFNAGISGHTTANGLARMEQDVISRKPDLVTVMFGLNDMTRVPPETYLANLKEIVTRCRAAGSEVIFATPNNVIDTSDRPVEKLIQYCDLIRQAGRELNVPVCDVYREMDAIRARHPFDWRMMMSDAIHPNMAGHKAVAICLAQTISGQRDALDDVAPPPPLQHTSELIRAGKPVKVLAMAPFDQLIVPALKKHSAQADISVETWPVQDLTLAEIEESARTRVRAMKPDLVVINVPGSASVKEAEAFANSFAWIMNWSLNFGSPTWDVVVVHPSVNEGHEPSRSHDALIRQLVNAQDLTIIDRPADDNTTDAAGILAKWLTEKLP